MILMWENEPVISYEIFQDLFCPREVFSSENLPCDIEELSEWFASRFLSPYNSARPFLTAYAGVGYHASVWDMQLSTGLFSLIDHYWVQEELGQYSWETDNLFVHEWDEVTVSKFIPKKEGRIFNPSYTTPGNLSKYWVREQEKFYLYKSHELDTQNVYAERLAYLLGIALGLSVPSVEIKDNQDKIISFTSLEVEFIPALWVKDYFTDDMLMDMHAFDYLIGNEDRHKLNYGVLLDSHKNISMAPLFDHGRSLLWRGDPLLSSGITSITSAFYKNLLNIDFSSILDEVDLTKKLYQRLLLFLEKNREGIYNNACVI